MQIPLYMKEKKIYKDIVASIVSAVDAKDTYTAVHSNHVGDMAGFICRKMGLDEETSMQIYIAGKLHDVGKIGIPDNILNKNGKLTDSEWNLMKEHARIGAHILSQSNQLRQLSHIVLYHHERWDGKGYYGLKEEEINIGARIIAACDSIDAMLSERVYRKALSEKECKEEIKVNKGQMYDPKVVEVIINNWDELLEASGL